MDSCRHAIGSIHQKWDGTMIDLAPLEIWTPNQYTSQCREGDDFLLWTFNFHSQWRFVTINKFRGPKFAVSRKAVDGVGFNTKGTVNRSISPLIFL